MVRKPLITQGYSLAEEIANSISHGIGLVFGIVGLVLLLVQAVDANAGAMAITSYSLYGGSMILLFLASTLYHAVPHQRAKLWLKKIRPLRHLSADCGYLYPFSAGGAQLAALARPDDRYLEPGAAGDLV
ncbi:hemolysin [Raoultella terrigena]|uniref:Hemolysin n=1 Tax=Raoultella terrigena TaxID=577 RepID=A0A4U9D005_RAOTE|nr:hemolysin [Raoultella terrigena]